METLIVVHDDIDAKLLRQAMQETDCVTVIQYGQMITGIAYDVIVCAQPHSSLKKQYVDEVLRTSIKDPSVGRVIFI